MINNNFNNDRSNINNSINRSYFNIENSSPFNINFNQNENIIFPTTPTNRSLNRTFISQYSYLNTLSPINRAKSEKIKNELNQKKIEIKDVSKLDENKNGCVICLEKFENNQQVYKLDCSHIFHIFCLNKEIENRQKCPVCRKEL